MYDTVPNHGQAPPCNAFQVGNQTDGAGPLWTILATTPHGLIPGKGRKGRGVYCYGGKEHVTNDFHFFRVRQGSRVELKRGGGAPPRGAVTGYQDDSSGMYYAVVCNTNHGRIPGKSNGRQAWYPYGGKEHSTHDFSYVTVHGDHHGHHGNPLFPGAVVHLHSRAHGKNIRIYDGVVDGRGGTADWATFEVQPRGHGHVALRLAAHPHIYLAIKGGALTSGIGGKFCTFKIHEHGDRDVSLESVPHPGQHVGVLPGGDAKAPHETGRGEHGRFNVHKA